MPKEFDVSAICNALVDIVIEVEDSDLAYHGLTKARMHLVDQRQQDQLLRHFAKHEKTIELGGSALNAIRALALLKQQTVFGGAIANDHFGDKIRDRMSQLAIKPALLTLEDDATGTCLVLVTPDGERTMVTYLGASRHYTTNSIPADEIASSKIFHFCGYQWDTDEQKRAIRMATEIAKKNQVLISFDIADPAVVIHHREDFLEMVQEGVDVYFGNREETEVLFEMNYLQAAEVIAQTGAIVVIKLGGDGALVRFGEQSVKVEAVPTTVVDTTAAGDMFAAGFLYGLSLALPLATCGRIAATMASDAISRHGANISAEALKEVSKIAQQAEGNEQGASQMAQAPSH